MMLASLLAQVIWQAPVLAPISVAMLALVVAAMLWLYPPQTSGVPSGWRWAMPTLRGMAVAAVAAAVVQPVVLRPRTTAREGAIVILADRSHSMSVVDRDRSPAELVALAAGLGALPEGARIEPAPGLRGQLDALRGAIEQVVQARSEAEYARLSGRGAAAANARLRDSVARLAVAIEGLPQPPADDPELAAQIAALKEIAPRPDDPTLTKLRQTLSAAAGALARAQARADERLLEADPQVQAICARLGRLPREALLETGLTQPGAGVLPNLPAGVPVYGFSFAEDLRPVPLIAPGRTEPLHLQPFGAASDVAGAIRAVLQRMGNRPVQAIVLLSDGRQVGGDAEGINSDASAAGVPIFAVETAAHGPRRDVSIVALDLPSSARVGQTVAARVEVRATGFHGDTIDVRLDAGNVRQLRRVTLADDAGGVAEFELTFPRSGPQQVVASVLPQPGEVTDKNNRAIRQVRVGGEPVRVLVIAGPDAGRQYASLHASLSRTGWVSLREVEEEDVPTLTPRSILDQDVIVLCDVPAYELSASQWSAVAQAARQRGTGVIVCVGRNAPAGYAEHWQARQFLPYDPGGRTRAWQSWPGGEPHFRILPAPGADALAGEEFWRQLQPISRFVPLSPLLDDARAMLIERESGAAVLTSARRGIGSVYFVGTDQSWRWRGTIGGGTGRDQFWPQLVRLAAGEPYVANEEHLWLDVSPLAAEPERSVAVRARILDAYGEPIDAATQTLYVRQEGLPVRDVTLTSIGERSGQYAGTIPGLPAGDYDLRLDPPDDPTAEIPPDPVRLRLRVAVDYEAEMSDVSADDRLLRRIAEASGGQFLTLDQLNTLPRRLTEVRQRQSRLVEYPLWDSPYLFVFVLACLSAEWALRKKFGLA